MHCLRQYSFQGAQKKREPATDIVTVPDVHRYSTPVTQQLIRMEKLQSNGLAVLFVYWHLAVSADY